MILTSLPSSDPVGLKAETPTLPPILWLDLRGPPTLWLLCIPGSSARSGFHRLFAVSGRFRREGLGLSFSDSYLPGNLHLQDYLGLLKLAQMSPMTVDLTRYRSSSMGLPNDHDALIKGV